MLFLCRKYGDIKGYVNRAASIKLSTVRVLRVDKSWSGQAFGKFFSENSWITPWITWIETRL
ncbi:MAG: hypothetical protein HFE52_03405 [Clostridia bacterium]|nr:hypothetical protein [Clostridia bacterium]